MCPSCGAIQPPRPDTDLFGALGLERRYFVDKKDVMTAWRAASRKVHPDRFAGKSAVQRRMSLQWTATVNEAKRVLTDPVRRARYLATGQAEAPETGGPQLDADFLEEMFDLQMAAASDPEGVRARAQALHEAFMADIESAFRTWEAGEGDLDAVPERLARLKYVGTALSRTA